MKTTEEKTVKQWLNTLKEPYKTKAIQQTNKEILKTKESSLIDALYSMFVWEGSKEGDQYWRDLVINLDNLEIFIDKR